MSHTFSLLSAAFVEGRRSLIIRTLMLLAPVLLMAPNMATAQAGVYSDDLGKCLVKSTDDNDRVLLVQWVFSIFSLNPAVGSLAAVTTAQRDSLNKKAETIFSRLLTGNCRKETIDALKYEGDTAIAASFQVLGQVASRDLMTDPHVAVGMKQFGHYFSGDQKLKALLKDAGISR